MVARSSERATLEVGQARSSRVPALHVGFPTDSRHDRHMERDLGNVGRQPSH